MGFAGRVLVFVLLVGACGGDGAGQGGTLRAVSIAEQPPYARDPGVRAVQLAIELEQAPVCDAAVRYGFLIDVDGDAATGVTGEGLEGIGAEAQIVVRCADGELASSLGTLAIDDATIRIDTTVAALPAVEFRFLGFILDGGELQRLPEAPDSAAWAIVERRTP